MSELLILMLALNVILNLYNVANSSIISLTDFMKGLIFKFKNYWRLQKLTRAGYLLTEIMGSEMLPYLH
jgi:hypothetical protein